MTPGVAPGETSPARRPPRPLAVGETDRAIRDVLPDLVRQVPIGIAIVRRDRSIAYHNEEFGRLLGPPAPTTDGRDEHAILAPLLQADGAPHADGEDPFDLVTRDAEPVTRVPVMVQRPDGDTGAASVTMAPLIRDGGEVIGAAVYAESMSEDLTDPALQDAFVAVLSHELRTPITSIYGGTQLLLRDRMPAPLRSTIIRDIASEAERLQGLVEDLLAITRIDRGLVAGDREPILLQHLTSAAAVAEQRRWPGHRIEVHADVDLPAVAGDEGFTLQVLRNLISNAVKYGPPDEPVIVTARASGDRVSVEVLDRGPGFPAGTGADAFRLFYRSPAVATRIDGSGIGLFVARGLVEAQGGRIWVGERPGGGAEVGFDLPVYELDGTD